jgi:ADP-ribosylglycohydrolase
VADALANRLDLAKTLKAYARSYPTSYGMHFRMWAHDQLPDGPYGSWGNGAAMRVSSAAWLATSFEECMELAKASAAVTHNHPEGIRSAQAVAAAIYAGLSGWDRRDIRAFIERAFGYDLSATTDELMLPSYFELKAWISIPKAMTCAFEAETVEEAIRNAVYLGADADTEAAIAGSIAETWSKAPAAVIDAVMAYFPAPLRKKVRELKAQMDQVVRRPLTKEHAADLVLWNPEDLAEWNRMQDADQIGEMAAARATVSEQLGFSDNKTPDKQRNIISRVRHWLNWF